MIALWIFLLVLGLSIAILASSPAVNYARALAADLGAPAFIVGVVLVAIGTDLPEIANSIAAHLQGEGDINVGDSVGSTLTQYTFVLGLFPVLVAVIGISRHQVGWVGLFTAIGLTVTIVFVADGFLSRWEGAALVSLWGIFTYLLIRLIPGTGPEDAPAVRIQGRFRQVLVVLGMLAIVGWSAFLAVFSLIKIAEIAGVPEFLIAFFGASLGTSAPEMVVVATALLRGAPAIALGDALGSSFVDSTLSIGIGPLVAPAEVTARTSIVATLYTLAAVAIVTAVLFARRLHDRKSMILMLGLYAAAYVVVIVGDE